MDAISAIILFIVLSICTTFVVLVVSVAFAHRAIRQLRRQIIGLTKRLNQLEEKRPAESLSALRSTNRSVAVSATPKTAAPPTTNMPFAEPARTAAPVPVFPQRPATIHLVASPPTSPLPSPQSHVAKGAENPACGNDTGMERSIATRVAIWIGAISIALGCVYLVKYSFDNGILSPLVRVAIGAAFGLALVIAGWWTRRNSPGPAQGMAAAGVAAVYASLLAAADLYHFFPASMAFILLAVWTGLAVALSLVMGPLIAVLGLLGGLLMPALLHAHHPHAGPLFLYLLLLQGAVLVVTRKRSWLPLAIFCSIGANLWVWIWLATVSAVTSDGLVLGFFVLASTASLLMAASAASAQSNASPGGRWVLRNGWISLAWIGVILGTINCSLVVGAFHFSNIQWMFMAILAAASLILGRLKEPLRAFPWLAAGIVFLTFPVWSIHPFSAMHFAWGNSPAGINPGFDVWLGAFGLLFAGGGYVCLWGSHQPAWWARLSIFSAAASVAIALQAHHFSHQTAWAGIALAIAGAYAIGAFLVHLRPGGTQRSETAIAALALGIAGFVALAAGLYFKNSNFTLALAVELALAALIWRSVDVSTLPVIVQTLAFIVAIRLLCNPYLLDYPIAHAPILLNWIAAGYGGSAILFVLARWWIRDKPAATLKLQLDASIVLFLLAGSTLLIRQAFHPAGWRLGTTGLMEFAFYAIASLGLAIIAVTQTRRSTTAQPAATFLAALGLCYSFGGTLLLANPLWVDYSIRGPLDLAVLTPVYLLPAILLCVLGLLAWQRKQTGLARLVLAAAMLLAFLFISFATRAGFHSGGLDTGTTGNAELYTYSLVWVIMGIGMLVAAIRLHSVLLRFASLAVMLITIVKVFLIDTSHLQNLLRVLSLVGLGVSLILLAYLYQRFIFRKPAAPR